MALRIDKGNSPLWVKILVWILVGGLIAASITMAVGLFVNFAAWDEDPQPITLTPDDLPPEILEQLQQQQLEQQLQQEQGEGVDLDADTGAEGEAAPDQDADSDVGDTQDE